MNFLKDASPIRGVRDLVMFVRQSPKEHIIPAILAIFATGIMVVIFFVDAYVNTAPPPPPRVIYAEFFPAGRTDDDILRARWAIQCQKEAKWEEQRASYEKLARASGMDVDAMKRDIAKRPKPPPPGDPVQRAKYAPC
ncbi:MAG: hypothetical protein U5J78_05395 [Parasphingorhabdus sp.]|nr:hypothetical protein [Parasphingorhabdus sp.]